MKKIMKTGWLIALMMLLSCGIIKAQEEQQSPEILPQEKYIEALEDYKSDNFAAATVKLQDLYDSGYDYFEVCYNLGNCYFKMNDMASAILYYERADKISPGNENVKHNLEVANKQIVDKIEVVPALFYARLWSSITGWLDVTQWAYCCLLVFLLLAAAVVLIVVSKKLVARKSALITSVLLLLVFIFVLCINISLKKRYDSKDDAIVFTPTVSAKGSPTETGVDIFVIHRGTKVNIEDNIGDWIEIKLSDGKTGWIKMKDVKTI